MKILFLVTGMGLGGAEVQICELAKRMTALGHEVHIAWMTGEAGIDLPEGVREHPFRVNKTPWGFVKAIWMLRKLVRQICPDVIHAHMVHANLLARIQRLMACTHTPLVCTAHSSNEGGRLRMLAYRLTDSLCDLTTNVSSHAVDAFVERGASVSDRIRVVHNGVDIERFSPDDLARQVVRKSLGLIDKVIILIVGRLEPPKNHASLLRAYAQIAHERPHVHLVIAGYGSLETELKTLVETLAVSDQVSFLGVRADTPALFNAADIVVVSSRFEGFGLVLVEGMACGKFIVTTDCGGIAAVLRDLGQEFGLVVPVEDDTALQVALQAAIETPHNVRMQAGEKARAHVVEHYSIDAITQQWLGIYRVLVEPSQKALKT